MQSAMIGNNIVRLSLECIKYWAEWFPYDLNDKTKPTEFKLTYDSFLL